MIYCIGFGKIFFYLLVLASLSKQSEWINNDCKILIISNIAKYDGSYFQSGKVELTDIIKYLKYPILWLLKCGKL
jgi:hypothetical protein